MTLVHAEPSSRWIWVTACVVLVVIAGATNTRATFALSVACLLAAFASGLMAVRLPVHQVWADTATQTLVLREAYLAGPRDQRLERAEIAALECVFLGPAGKRVAAVSGPTVSGATGTGVEGDGVRGDGATYKLRVVLASGDTIDLTGVYDVPVVEGRLFQAVAPYQAAMAVRQALAVPILGIDAWERPWSAAPA